MSRSYRFDDVLIDLPSFRMLKGGKALAVEPKALNVLVFLVENSGRLVERRELISAVWGDTFVTDHVLNRAIGQLRKVLGDDAKEPRYIETVPTLGYRFIAKVEAVDPEAVAKGTSTRQFAATRGAAAALTGAVAADGGSSGPELPARLLGSSPVELRGWSSVPSPDRHAATFGRRRPVATVVVSIGALAVVIFGALWISARSVRRSVGEADIRSLVVLPLENLSGDSSQDYLADGMTDELITGLGQIGALRVISQTTAKQYKNAHKSTPEIAKELNVDAVVEGSVARAGDRIRISAQLIAAQTDRQLWARSFDGELRDVLGLQNQVAAALAQQIQVELTSKEQTQLAGTREVNPRAYEALLKGYYFEQNSFESETKSLQYFQQAAEIDPKFARAYVGIARSYNFLADDYYLPGAAPETSRGVPVGEAMAASDAAVGKALELDPALGEAYAERAWTLMLYHWDSPGAQRDFSHALELDPGSSTAHEGYADYFVAMGRFDEGLQEMKRARDLDPLSPLVLTDYCNDLTFARRYDEALAQCAAALEISPDYQWALEVSANVYGLKGDNAQVHKAFAKLGCGADDCAAMDEIFGAPGPAVPFDAWVKKQTTAPSPFFLAFASTRLGRKDQAFAMLEKAYEQRADLPEMYFLGVDPHFDPLRSDPRFSGFLRRTGLPPEPHSAANAANSSPKN